MGSAGGGDSPCASWSGPVPANDRHVLHQPVVVPIFWGHFYAKTPDAVSETKRLLGDLVSGRFMDGARQYGVSKGSVDPHILIDVAPDKEPTTLSDQTIVTQLRDWLKLGTVVPTPAKREQNRLYFIFPPTTADLTGSSTDPFEGYHEYAWYPQPQSGDGDPGPYNLFWAIVRTESDSTDTSTGLKFAQSRAYIVSHELIEAATDRDGNGFTTTSCEIGDICQATGASSCCSTYDYQGWQVESYWSNWDNKCIRGDEPLSLRRLLAILVIQVPADLQGAGHVRTHARASHDLRQDVASAFTSP
jgi:hypothetical protein